MAVETVLETERLRLTTWPESGAGEIAALHADPAVSRFLGNDGKPWSPQLAAEMCEEWRGLYTAHKFGKQRLERKADGKFAGRAGFGIYEPTGEPEIGYAFFREYWGQGYATEIAAALRDWYFEETHRKHFIGFADALNPASIRVLRKIGMRHTRNEVTDEGFEAAFHILTRDEWHG